MRAIDVSSFGDSQHAINGFMRFERARRSKEEHAEFFEYLGFSEFIQGAFIDKDAHIIDTGNFSDVNAELMMRIAEKIKKHPKIWKWFFKIG